MRSVPFAHRANEQRPRGADSLLSFVQSDGEPLLPQRGGFTRQRVANRGRSLRSPRAAYGHRRLLPQPWGGEDVLDDLDVHRGNVVRRNVADVLPVASLAAAQPTGLRGASMPHRVPERGIRHRIESHVDVPDLPPRADVLDDEVACTLESRRGIRAVRGRPKVRSLRISADKSSAKCALMG